MYSFNIHGHKNILGTHETTIEFTKDNYLTKAGDCILGINSEFILGKLKKFRNVSLIKIKITIGGLEEEIVAKPYKKFKDSHELVIRKSNYKCDRTFAIQADKASIDVDRRIIAKLQNPKSKAKITIKKMI